MTPDPGGSVRLADVMAALSIATDLSVGQPVDHAMRTCIVAMRLGDALGFDDTQLHDVYDESLLRYIGCNADTAWLASVVGDEIALRAAFAEVDAGNDCEVIATPIRIIRQSNAGAGIVKTAAAVLRGPVELPKGATSSFLGHCDVARSLAGRLGFPARFADTVGQLYSRWDGRGVPALKGEAIAPAFCCTALAQDAIVFHRLGGVDAATASGMSDAGARMVGRAALVHNIGKVAVSSGVWGKAAALTEAGRALVRRHPYETGRVFGRSESLGAIGALAALHHETLDGSGYHRGLHGDMLSPAARLLVAANVFQTRLENRPHRGALAIDAAAGAVQSELEAGRLVGDAVRAVPAAARPDGAAVAPGGAAPLIDREREVLTLLARGFATKQIASELQIAYKTAGRHIQNVYGKVGVNTRAATTLYAMRQRLV